MLWYFTNSTMDANTYGNLIHNIEKQQCSNDHCLYCRSNMLTTRMYYASARWKTGGVPGDCFYCNSNMLLSACIYSPAEFRKMRKENDNNFRIKFVLPFFNLENADNASTVRGVEVKPSEIVIQLFRFERLTTVLGMINHRDTSVRKFHASWLSVNLYCASMSMRKATTISAIIWIFGLLLGILATYGVTSAPSNIYWWAFLRSHDNFVTINYGQAG